jgi:hypothetical protein
MNDNNPILETKEFKLLLNLLEKTEQIISIINLPDSSVSKYNTLKKMTFDMLNLNFIPLQKRKLEGNIETSNETLNILHMLNTQKIILIELLLDFIMNNNSVVQKKNLNHFLGSLTEIYNLSKEPFDKITEDEIFYEVYSETNKLSEMFTRIDKIFVENYDANKQIRLNYEYELNKLREKYDKDLDELKISLGKSSFQKQSFIKNHDFTEKNNQYLNQLNNLIDNSYEKYKRYHPNEELENNMGFNYIRNIERLKLDFVQRVMNNYFEEGDQMKIRDLDLNNNIECHHSGNCLANKKLDDICSFLPNVQRESDLFHKKFCELMNYIETNIEEKS